ncbi:hypothetical protein OCU04_001263 [Sclerotinia nivalis]|uniref:Uncharacterized protein n=1 Tax=Sclerotinia nivalis TaxID=352851 RepID=A0A9X0AXS5_9HELO|nr:hypothetical protein OCU04_001263 [Sclerotinia nivalis]
MDLLGIIYFLDEREDTIRDGKSVSGAAWASFVLAFVALILTSVDFFIDVCDVMEEVEERKRKRVQPVTQIKMKDRTLRRPYPPPQHGPPYRRNSSSRGDESLPISEPRRPVLLLQRQTHPQN